MVDKWDLEAELLELEKPLLERSRLERKVFAGEGSTHSREAQSLHLGMLDDKAVRSVAARLWKSSVISGECKLMPKRTSGNGYYPMSVTIDGKTRYRSAHRLAYLLYKGPIPAGALVRHTCHNPRCVNPAHLLLGSHQDNKNDCVEALRHTRHERNPKAKLYWPEVEAIRARYARKGISMRALGDEYGVSPAAISDIISRKTWRPDSKSHP